MLYTAEKSLSMGKLFKLWENVRRKKQTFMGISEKIEMLNQLLSTFQYVTVILSLGECMHYSYPTVFIAKIPETRNKGPLRSNIIEARNYLIGLHENCITDIGIISHNMVAILFYGGTPKTSVSCYVGQNLLLCHSDITKQ
jgi:hypothetical protein